MEALRFLEDEKFSDAFTLIARHASHRRMQANKFGTRFDAEPLYVHLRVRGFSRYDSFVAAYGEDWFGHPDAIEHAARSLEGKEYEAAFLKVGAAYPEQELFDLWDKHATFAKVKTSISVKALADTMARLEEKASERYRQEAEALRAAEARDRERADTEAENLRKLGLSA